MGTKCFATHSTRIRLPMSPNSKIPNWVRRYPPPLVRCCNFFSFECRFPCGVVQILCVTSPLLLVLAGRLVWRWFPSGCTPSHHALRAACVQLLPLIEMYCRYVLEEDCSSLWALMVRYDCEADLASHDLGRSMLAMLRDDDDDGPRPMPAPMHMSAPISPFDAIRGTLAAMDVALQTMRPQVLLALDVTCFYYPAERSCCNFAPRSVCFRAGVCPSPVNGEFGGPLIFLGSLGFLCLLPPSAISGHSALLTSCRNPR